MGLLEPDGRHGRRLRQADLSSRHAPPLPAVPLAILINETSHALALHAWTGSAEPGADPWAYGTELQRARVRDGLWTVADAGAGPVAGLQVWPPRGREAVARAAGGLRAARRAPGAGARRPLRQRGRVAEDIAGAADLPRLSLIVSDANAGARRLYAPGFRQRASLPMIKEGWEGPGSAWLLLVKDPV